VAYSERGSNMELGQAFMTPQEQMQRIETGQAQQQYYQAQTAEAQQKAVQAQKMMQLFGQPEEGGMPALEGDIPSMMDKFAHRAMGAGLVEEGGKFAKQAADIRQSEAARQSSQASASKSLIEQGLKAIDLSKQYLMNARSQADLDKANATWTALTGTMSPLSGEVWSSALMQEFADETLALEGKLTSADRTANQQMRKDEAASRAEFRDALIGIKQDTLLQRKREQEAKAKTGGGVVGVPTKVELDQAALIIRQSYPAFKGDKDLEKQAAFDIASEAKALRAANPGLTSGEALNQAFEKAKAAGDFQVVETWGGLSKTPKYKESKPAGPAVAPPPTERVVGKTTITKDGVTYIWTESGGQKGWAPQGGQ
jgi:hypothetical protein